MQIENRQAVIGGCHRLVQEPGIDVCCGFRFGVILMLLLVAKLAFMVNIDRALHAGPPLNITWL